jgi:hypothetical protein
MVRKFAVLGLCFTAGLFAVSTASFAADEKKLTIKDCMKFQGKNGLANKVNADAKAEKWEDAQKKSAELKKFGEAIGKNDPPMGSKESWEKLTKKFKEEAEAVDTAAQAKKAGDVDKAVKALLAGTNCQNCHKEHKPK